MRVMCKQVFKKMAVLYIDEQLKWASPTVTSQPICFVSFSFEVMYWNIGNIKDIFIQQAVLNKCNYSN